MNRPSRLAFLASVVAVSITWQPASGGPIFMPEGSTVWMKFQTGQDHAIGSNQAGLAPPNGIPLTTFTNELDPAGRGTGYAEILPGSIRTFVDGFRSSALMNASYQDTYTVGGTAAGPFDITIQLHVTGFMTGLTLFGQTSLIGNVEARIGFFSPISELGGVPLNEGFRVAAFDAGAQASTGTISLFGPAAAASIPVDLTASYTKTGVNVGDVFDIGYQLRSQAVRGQIDLRNTGTISFNLPDGVFLTSALEESLAVNPVPEPGGLTLLATAGLSIASIRPLRRRLLPKRG